MRCLYKVLLIDPNKTFFDLVSCVQLLGCVRKCFLSRLCRNQNLVPEFSCSSCWNQNTAGLSKNGPWEGQTHSLEDREYMLENMF